MCCFSPGKGPNGLVKPKPPGCIFSLWDYCPRFNYFTFLSGWEYSCSPPLPPPHVLIKDNRAVFNSVTPLLGFSQGRCHLRGQFLKTHIL